MQGEVAALPEQNAEPPVPMVLGVPMPSNPAQVSSSATLQTPPLVPSAIIPSARTSIAGAAASPSAESYPRRPQPAHRHRQSQRQRQRQTMKRTLQAISAHLAMILPLVNRSC